MKELNRYSMNKLKRNMIKKRRKKIMKLYSCTTLKRIICPCLVNTTTIKSPTSATAESNGDTIKFNRNPGVINPVAQTQPTTKSSNKHEEVRKDSKDKPRRNALVEQVNQDEVKAGDKVSEGEQAGMAVRDSREAKARNEAKKQTAITNRNRLKKQRKEKPISDRKGSNSPSIAKAKESPPL
jgi:hypothetical protein